jgi:hypothetical protein
MNLFSISLSIRRRATLFQILGATQMRNFQLLLSLAKGSEKEARSIYSMIHGWSLSKIQLRTLLRMAEVRLAWIRMVKLDAQTPQEHSSTKIIAF